MLFELQELNQKASQLKPDNSDIILALNELSDKINSLELKPEIKVESKKVKVEPIIKPKIKVSPAKVEINQDEIIIGLKELKEKINSNPNLITNKLISELINKIDSINFQPKIKVESKEVKVEPIIQPKIKVNPTPVKIEKTDVHKSINWLFKSLENLLLPLGKKISTFINKMLEYIKEPDKIIISEYEMIEYYGDKKITYHINDDGRKMEIIKDES